jgi:hypothetical protein
MARRRCRKMKGDVHMFTSLGYIVALHPAKHWWEKLKLGRFKIKFKCPHCGNKTRDYTIICNYGELEILALIAGIISGFLIGKVS